MSATINVPAFKAICREICANLPALLAERNPIYPDEPMFPSALAAVRTELAERRKEWATSVKPAKTRRDYELDFAAAAHHTRSHAQWAASAASRNVTCAGAIAKARDRITVPRRNATP
jgi:hypothetical protein